MSHYEVAFALPNKKGLGGKTQDEWVAERATESLSQHGVVGALTYITQKIGTHTVAIVTAEVD